MIYIDGEPTITSQGVKNPYCHCNYDDSILICKCHEDDVYEGQIYN